MNAFLLLAEGYTEGVNKIQEAMQHKDQQGLADGINNFKALVPAPLLSKEDKSLLAKARFQLEFLKLRDRMNSSFLLYPKKLFFIKLHLKKNLG